MTAKLVWRFEIEMQSLTLFSCHNFGPNKQIFPFNLISAISVKHLIELWYDKSQFIPFFLCQLSKSFLTICLSNIGVHHLHHIVWMTPIYPSHSSTPIPSLSLSLPLTHCTRTASLTLPGWFCSALSIFLPINQGCQALMQRTDERERELVLLWVSKRECV